MRTPRHLAIHLYLASVLASAALATEPSQFTFEAHDFDRSNLRIRSRGDGCFQRNHGRPTAAEGSGPVLRSYKWATRADHVALVFASTTCDHRRIRLDSNRLRIGLLVLVGT